MSRPKRWQAAVNKARNALEALQELEPLVDEAQEPKTATQDLDSSTPSEEQTEDIQARWSEHTSELVSALQELEEIQTEYQEWRDNLPDSLSSAPVAEKLDNVIGIDISGAISEAEDLEGKEGPDIFEADFSNLDSTISEIEDTDLPLGFGRD